METPADIFVKQPLGGIDRRALVRVLAEQGPVVARADLERDRAALKPTGLTVREDECVLMLGGSNGITRSLVVQLVFGERMPVYCVHYDSEKLQIGPQHAAAIKEAAQTHGVEASFRNADATRPEIVDEVVRTLREKYRVVHLINGIAAGATKRYAEHGKTFVPDLDVAFDQVRQIADFSSWACVRKLGHVEVDVATEQDITRTNAMMGTSTTLWADALFAAGLLDPARSVIAFADYDYEPNDPVYAMGPLAGAKQLQRESLAALRAKHKGLRTVRLCYPAMNTTAIGAIPGALLLYAMTASILHERNEFQSLQELARDSMPMFDRNADDTLWLDLAYKRALPEFHARRSDLTVESLHKHVRALLLANATT